MKSHTVPVQFQYGAHSARNGNSFQNHHTLHTSNKSYDSKTGRFSTTLCMAPGDTEFLEIQLQTFQYLDNSVPTWSLGVKST